MPVLKQMKADCLNVQVFDTRDAMGCAAGECACATIRELLEKKRLRTCHICGCPISERNVEDNNRCKGY